MKTQFATRVNLAVTGMNVTAGKMTFPAVASLREISFMKTALLISLLSLAPTALGAPSPGADERPQEAVQQEQLQGAEVQPPTVLTDEEAIRLRQDFERAIQSIEINSGAFDAQLVEPLGSLSELLRAAGEHEQALRLAMRALHINRINNGFYEANHLKLVDRIIDSNAALQRWEDLDNNYAYYYWLSQRAYPDQPTQQAAALERVFDWKLVHLALQSDADRSHEILELEDIADQRIRLLAQAFGDSHPALAPALYQRALVHYLHFKALDENNSTGRRLLEREHRYPAEQRRTSIFGEGSLLLSNEQSHPAMTNQLYRGRNLIELMGRITAAGDSPASQQAHAMALLYRADWELLMGRRGEALEGYRAAYEAFLKAGISADRLETYFARPLVLPRDRFLSRLPELDSAPDAQQLEDYIAWTRILPGIELPVSSHADFLELRPDYLDVRLDLDVDGATFKTRDPRSVRRGEGEGNTDGLEILNEDAVDPETLRKASQELRLLTFRPRLIRGEAVPAEDLRMKFFLPQQH